MTLPPQTKGSAVPSGRLSRLARFGGMATGIAGNMLAGGVAQLARGKRPSVGDLLMTPANALRVTNQLAHLRGAAMKIGQLLSMDGGEFVPPELAEILARLRTDAQPMPRSQVQSVLDLRWGVGWAERFEHFDFTPIAAASIGQVHRARTRDGRHLAVKIQYPGIRLSIDSDVDNVAALIRLSGQLPPTIDIKPMLAEAKRQLHEEADYVREGAHLARFGALLAGASDYVVPTLHADLTNQSVLAMDHVSGVPIESLVDAPQDERDRVVTLLLDLSLRELFEFGLMQTDPNFGNYRYDPVTRRLILLDFGATRAFPAELAERYRMLIGAALANDLAGVRAAIDAIGLIAESPARYEDEIMAMLALILERIHRPGPFDFADRSLVEQLRDRGLALAADREVWHVPPIDTLFLHRKFAGMFLLGSRLKARVDIVGLAQRYVSGAPRTP